MNETAVSLRKHLKKKKGRRVIRGRSQSSTVGGMSGSGARRRPGEETDQCAAEWKASNTLLLTRPKHFEACFHREQLGCETAGVKLTPPAPISPSSLERLDDTFIRSQAPAAVAPACSHNGAHPRQAKCSSLPEGPRRPPPAPAPSAAARAPRSR